MGKTMIVEKFARDHPSHFDPMTGRIHMPVIVQMVSGPNEARFLHTVAGRDRGERTATIDVVDAGKQESKALRLLSEIQPGLLVIDEVHSLQAGTEREQIRFLNMLRFLGNELRIPLVCVGKQQARNALRTDDQLVRRFEAFALPPWKNDDDFGGLIGSLQRSLPLRRPSEFAGATLKRLIEVTGGITASIFSLVTTLAIAAIESGEERITPDMVADKRNMLALLGEPV